MIDLDAPERASLEEAYRRLYLLPGAPRELIEAAYHALSNGGASPEVRAAYETALAAPVFAVDPYPRRLSPWELLHLEPDAPEPLLAAAYSIWLGGAEPLVIGRPERMIEQPVEIEEEQRDVPSVPDVFIFAFEELAADEPEESYLEEEREDADVAETHLFAFEEFAPELDGGPGVSTSAEPTIDGPHVVGPSGAAFVLTERPLRIGTQPACDIVVRASARIEARVWLNKGRVLVHALGGPGDVLVNGANVTWAVLSDGDTVAVGPETFSYHAG
jgi:hypothetical protein